MKFQCEVEMQKVSPFPCHVCCIYLRTLCIPHSNCTHAKTKLFLYWFIVKLNEMTYWHKTPEKLYTHTYLIRAGEVGVVNEWAKPWKTGKIKTFLFPSINKQREWNENCFERQVRSRAETEIGLLLILPFPSTLLSSFTVPTNCENVWICLFYAVIIVILYEKNHQQHNNSESVTKKMRKEHNHSFISSFAATERETSKINPIKKS
jgi:hypothetical protein